MTDTENRWFGFWGSSSDEVALPRVEDWIDPQWDPEDKMALREYIEGSPLVVACASPRTRCQLCLARLEVGSFRSDGVWLWPSKLSHYLKDHAVRLPDSLIAHIRAQKYLFPTELAASLEELPWPIDVS